MGQGDDGDGAVKLADVGDVPVVLDAEQLAELAGVSAWSIYEGVRRGDSPFAHVRVGRTIRFSTAAALRVLGHVTEAPSD